MDSHCSWRQRRKLSMCTRKMWKQPKRTDSLQNWPQSTIMAFRLSILYSDKPMEDLKRDLYQIRDILDMMDFLLTEKGNQPYRVKPYPDILNRESMDWI